MEIKKIFTVSLIIASMVVISQSAVATKDKGDKTAKNCKDIVIDQGSGDKSIVNVHKVIIN